MKTPISKKRTETSVKTVYDAEVGRIVRTLFGSYRIFNVDKDKNNIVSLITSLKRDEHWPQIWEVKIFPKIISYNAQIERADLKYQEYDEFLRRFRE